MDDERAFWTLAVLVERVLPEAYYSESMAGCMIDQKVFHDIIKKRLPTLSAHMEKIGMVIELGCLQWFLCLYSRTFPSEVLHPLLKKFSENFRLLKNFFVCSD